MNPLTLRACVVTTLLTISSAMAGYFNKPVPIPKVEDKDAICFALYTVQNNTMKMLVQFYPLQDTHSRTVSLQIKKNNAWESIQQQTIRENSYGKSDGVKAWNLLFRVEGWDDHKDWPYRIVALDGVATYEGVIRRNPIDKEEIVVAAFTGNSRWDRGPRKDIIDAVAAQNPDLLFFSGDQIYNHSSHLAEWLIFGSEFGEITRNRPTICIPDDHDVGQGNLWGSSGKRSTRKDATDGGYLMPPEYVREVEFAQTSNLPDPFDPTPVQQGIGVYYTSLNVGGIDFAIIEDRKFKNGPLEIHPDKLTGSRPDLPQNINPAELDSPDAVLLGERQLKFLDAWGKNWTDAQMKCVLSATIFAQGNTKDEIDLDSNGWPQTGRNRALTTIRKSYAFMLGGDQHLATIIHHGIEDFGDAGYSFCVPSIVNHFPRFWEPNQPAVRAIDGPLEHLGDYFDGLGNRVTMHAHANPNAFRPPLESKNERALQATGHGIVRFNKSKRTITMECWPRGADPTHADARQYPGWPMTISQMDNYGRKAVAYLPTLHVDGQVDPVVQVIRENDNEVVYTIRIKGNSFRPKVFENGKYTIRVGEGSSTQVMQGVEALAPDKEARLDVRLTQ